MTKDDEATTTAAAAATVERKNMAGGKIGCIVADKGENGPKESTMNGCISNHHQHIHNQEQTDRLETGDQSVADEEQENAALAPQAANSEEANEIISSNQTLEHTNQQQQKQRSAIRKQQQAITTNTTTTSTTTATSNSSAASDQQVPVSADYLAQLIKDKKQLSAFPPVFIHLQRLIDEEINKVRQSLFQLNDVVHQNEPLKLPEPEGEFVQLQEKIYVPVDEHPEYNFVGRLLGPRGMTAKQLEQETGCKIMIRGRGSMRDKKKEEQNRGKANWEHLNDELHVLITVEDTQNRAQIKLKRALEEVKQLLVPIVDGEDELKKRQLMELAIINGTYRDCNYNEALTKMLNDAAYRQTIADGSPNHQTAPQLHHQQQHSQQLVVANLPNGSPRHFGHMYTMNGSSVSSGIPSTGSNTPTSVHGQHQSAHQHQQKQMNAAAVAVHQHQQSVAAAVAAAQRNQPHHNQQHQHQTTTAAVVAAAAAAAAAQHSQHQSQHHLHQASQSPIPLPSPMGAPHPAQHLHHAQAPAVAAAAAAAALMGANPADPNALLYAQQYHDFHHYAAMAAAAAASQPLLAPADFAHHHHHQGHPLNSHHGAAAAAVAQAVAAAAASQQLQQHHYHQQVESDQQHQHQLAAAYQQHQQHQQQKQHQQQHQQQETSNNKTETDNGNESQDQQPID